MTRATVIFLTSVAALLLLGVGIGPNVVSWPNAVLVTTSDLIPSANVISTGNASTVTPADGTLLDLSNVNQSSAAEGLRLPQHATNCTNATTNGLTCYDTTLKALFVGDGTRAVPVTRESARFVTYGTGSTMVALLDSRFMSRASITAFLTSQSARFSQSFIHLGSSQKAYIEKLRCVFAPVVGTWDSGSDTASFQVKEGDDASGASYAGLGVGSAVTFSGAMTINPDPYGTANIQEQGIYAWTTKTGNARYFGVYATAVDGNSSVTAISAQCEVFFYRAL